MVEAAAKVKVSKKDPVKLAGSGNVPATEKNGSTSSKTETKPDATKRFSVCYMDVSKMYFFSQIKTFRKVCMAFVFMLQTL